MDWGMLKTFSSGLSQCTLALFRSREFALQSFDEMTDWGQRDSRHTGNSPECKREGVEDAALPKIVQLTAFVQPLAKLVERETATML